MARCGHRTAVASTSASVGNAVNAPAGTVNWRAELVKKLIGMQKIEAATGGGYWVNTENRWMEADPVLVTAYTLIALETALGPQP